MSHYSCNNIDTVILAALWLKATEHVKNICMELVFKHAHKTQIKLFLLRLFDIVYSKPTIYCIDIVIAFYSRLSLFNQKTGGGRIVRSLGITFSSCPN